VDVSALKVRLAAWYLGGRVHADSSAWAAQVLEALKDLGLVVIDPEDREQVARIESDFASRMHWRESTLHDERRDALHATLRSLITPPKPDEPQGLGAVVELREVVYQWIRAIHVGGGDWILHDSTGGTKGPVKYDDLEVVRVLSEGWRA
jgi:hypothetical protein